MESERIIFNKYTSYYSDNYIKMYTNKEIQLLIFKKGFDEVKIKEWVSKMKNDNNRYVMVEKETNDFIGDINLIQTNDKTIELIICITPEKQNMHFGTEAIKYIKNYIFNNTNNETIELLVKNSNKRAIHCYENIGFIDDNKSKIENNIHMSIVK